MQAGLLFVIERWQKQLRGHELVFVASEEIPLGLHGLSDGHSDVWTIVMIGANRPAVNSFILDNSYISGNYDK